MTNLLVWDDSRIQELGDLVNKTVVDFLEQFNWPPSDLIGRVAYTAERAVVLGLTPVCDVCHEEPALPGFGGECAKCRAAIEADPTYVAETEEARQ